MLEYLIYNITHVGIFGFIVLILILLTAIDSIRVYHKESSLIKECKLLELLGTAPEWLARVARKL